ncbi:hypothetical protein K3495_g11753 [Podosphaera aphanis]|nr:hypothetical protein K3495_g11753 [Podosphaera aphanis]
MTISPPRTTDRASTAEIQGNKFAEKMKEVLEILKTNLNFTKAQQEESASKNRSPAPAYRVGDLVFLSTRNITTARPSKKLDVKFIGPCKISKVINSHAYKLDLPFENKTIYDVFHTSLLRPSPSDPLPGQTQAPQQAIGLDAEGNELWAIDQILDSKQTKRDGFCYLIQWRGSENQGNTWEPLRNVVNATVAINEFKKRFPKKKAPNETAIHDST